jgi:hypothetical protein
MSHVSQRLRRRFTRFGGGKAKDGSAADALLLATVPRLGFSSARRLVRTSLLCPWIFACFLQLKALVQPPSRLHLEFLSILEFRLLFRSRLPTSISHDSLDKTSTKGLSPSPPSQALKACGFIFTYTPIPLPPSSHRNQFLALTSVHLRVLRLFSLGSFVSLRLWTTWTWEQPTDGPLFLHHEPQLRVCLPQHILFRLCVRWHSSHIYLGLLLFCWLHRIFIGSFCVLCNFVFFVRVRFYAKCSTSFTALRGLVL